MSETDTETESKCGGTTTDSTEETKETTSKCGGKSSKSAEPTESTDSSSSKCGGSSKSKSSSSSGCGSSKKKQTDEKVEATVDDFDGEPGQLVAVGLGPGRPSEMTSLAKETLRDAEHIVGYTTYVELLPDDIVEGAEDIYSTPMCGEVSRTEEAIDRTLAGNDVAIVGSGDPNVYALAGLALEILESKGATADMVDFDVVAGVPAAQSCAARLGAPLVNDTVTISLSDHLTSMPTIESRLHSAAKEGFTIVIYNPWSRKRRSNYEKCCEILLEHRDPETPVGIVHGAGREDERVEIVELQDLLELGETDLVDMTTTLLVGNEETYVWDDRMVTPRGYEQKYEY
ncbi:precorrin-3B C(17)-methyltransferase (plasmid) [Haloferax mediterranei ATCC 33500]|uniref:Cobalamin biosynthesis protein n=1 Tax=Haloferax mediterranei (strain ATCC 33500 / DSM 1411 / JCM 8866 / NBRC 14739 / NCIMB 2177 / R-4) TaxID=523841 RepID=I3R9I8_HALMT|nr:precorrin-3B C(17)-methyltransferase [Haloferax mediterranei]AFK20898.1 precorrin-3B C17-methyltransferase [Haloferax mediterranei ATCC 33500]AHZ24233.1 cobalamin biosynthesis protein [Haloferax mediterranei ATCC 33500]EMA05312.1 precorrin-3B C(17)-methyltransferase [Haloferax mediterranei ATCC 33500]MDX5989886.1 precorrin-3B C(17)-methyltransferase [Haloferax mediterranei ATCC 33500]QCQ77327.1 precorrin-3B C(17)-methyltransferase [Haloferax mediterranei ATCC 33500]